MGISLETDCSYVFLDSATLLPDDRDIAGHWASNYINDNPAYRWVVGKYVEADNPNRNNQMWALSELEGSKASILHAPLNILHRPQHIVGSFTGAEMNYPTDAASKKETDSHPNDPNNDEGPNNDMKKKKKAKKSVSDVTDPYPYMGAVAAFWKSYYPTELVVVERAFNEGSLFFSMECVSDTITFKTPAGLTETFKYAGPKSPTYGSWGDRANIRQFNKPHFLAGALIFPPAAPGWQGASIKEISKKVDANISDAEIVYEMFKGASPHLAPTVWEELMLSVVSSYK